MKLISFVKRTILLICLVPAVALSQENSGASRIQNEGDLTFALLSVANQSSAESLLRDHKDLINENLWGRLTDTAFQLDPPHASALYEDALSVANRLHAPRLIASTYYRVSRYQFAHGNIAAATESLLRSKQVFEEAGQRRDLIYVLADLGTLNIYSSQYEQARESSEQSIALADQLKTSNIPAGAFPDQYGVATALSNLGDVANWGGDHAKAIENYQRSLALYQKLDQDSSKYGENILDDLADIGRTYRRLGDHIQALIYLNKAMELAKRLTIADRVASICNSLGILYSEQRDYSKALGFYQEGLQFAVAANDRMSQANLLLNIAVAFQGERKYDEAIENFVKSLEIAKVLNDKETIVVVGEGIGAIYEEQGKYKEALDSLEKSLALASEIGDKRKIAELYWRTAEVQYAKRDYLASISSASAAVALADQLNLQNVSYLARTMLGRAQRAQKEDDLAFRTFSEAISRIEAIRNRVVGAEQESELFFEDKVGPYHESVDLLLSANKADNKAQALLMAERAKGRVLLDVLGRGKVDLSKTMSDREKEEDARLNKRIAGLNIQIAQENNKKDSDDTLLENLNGQLRSARIQYEAFQDSLYAAHPELRARRGQTPALTLREIEELVKDDKSAFLEYIVTQSKTYLFVLSKSDNSAALDVRVYPIEIEEKELIKQTREFREMLATESQIFTDTARRLYDLLVKPADEQLKGKSTVCIIPDGILWDLPFQALKPSESRYLLEDHALFYAPSLGVLREMSARRKTSQSPEASLLAFGNPSLPNEVAANIKAIYRGESLGPLPEAETEVRALGDIWGPTRSKVFVRANAGKRVFEAEASKYKVIHLATHGILDESNPMYSRLVLARAENDPNDDGLLEAREIMQLDLHADLVVLSACQTARGRYGAGEGMVGMSWAFFVAGVPTMVSSQWKVNSASTATLMISFHKHLKEQNSVGGSTKANALRQAALDLMKEPRYRHPFYWASFIMIGNGI